jgi:hypothetical protein
MQGMKIMSKAQSTKTKHSEHAGTARIVRKTKAAIAAGREILLPKAVVDRLAAGENPIRVLREWQGKKSL